MHLAAFAKLTLAASSRRSLISVLKSCKAESPNISFAFCKACKADSSNISWQAFFYPFQNQPYMESEPSRLSDLSCSFTEAPLTGASFHHYFTESHLNYSFTETTLTGATSHLLFRGRGIKKPCLVMRAEGARIGYA